MTTTPRNSNSSDGNKSALLTLFGALGTALVSSLCCIGPFIYLVFGVSAAGLSGLSQYSWLQWPMIAVSLSLLGIGFWRLYFSSRPFCTGWLTRRRMLWFYWIAVPVVLFLLFYPFFLAWVFEVFE